VRTAIPHPQSILKQQTLQRLGDRGHHMCHEVVSQRRGLHFEHIVFFALDLPEFSRPLLLFCRSLVDCFLLLTLILFASLTIAFLVVEQFSVLDPLLFFERRPVVMRMLNTIDDLLNDRSMLNTLIAVDF
jgi:hypothetical protein